MKKVMRWILMLSIGAGIGTAGCTRAYQTSGEEWITEEKECVLKNRLGRCSYIFDRLLFGISSRN